MKNQDPTKPLYILYGTPVPNVHSLDWDKILDKFPRPSVGRGTTRRSLASSKFNVPCENQLDAFDPSKFILPEQPVPGQFDDAPDRRRYRDVKPGNSRVSQSVICPVDSQEVNQVDPGEEADDSASDSSDSDSKMAHVAHRKLRKMSLASGSEV